MIPDDIQIFKTKKLFFELERYNVIILSCSIGFQEVDTKYSSKTYIQFDGINDFIENKINFHPSEQFEPQNDKPEVMKHSVKEPLVKKKHLA